MWVFEWTTFPPVVGRSIELMPAGVRPGLTSFPVSSYGPSSKCNIRPRVYCLMVNELMSAIQALSIAVSCIGRPTLVVNISIMLYFQCVLFKTYRVL